MHWSKGPNRDQITKWTMAQRECLLRLRKKPKTDKALAAVQRNLAKARRVYKRMRKSQK